MKLEIEDLKVKLFENAGQWKSEKVAIIAEFKDEFQELSSALQEVEKELAIANNRIETLTADLQLTREDFEELDAEFAEYRDNNPDKEYAEALEIDLNTVKDDLRQARERAELLEKDYTKVTEMKVELETAHAAVEELSSKCPVEFEGRIADLENDIASRDGIIDDLKKEMNDLMKDINEKCVILENDKLKLRDEVEKLIEEVKLKDQDILKAKNDASSQESTIEGLKKEIDEMENEMKSKSDEFKDEKLKLQLEIESLNGDAKSKEDTDAVIENLRKELEDKERSFKEKCEKLEDEKLELQGEVENLIEDVKLKDEVFVRTQKALDEVSENLLKDYEDKQKECESLEAEKCELTKELVKMNDEVEKKFNEIIEKDKVMQSLRSESDELVDLLRAKDDMLLDSAAALEEKESAVVQIKALEDGVDSVIEELIVVKGERDDLQKKLDNAIRERDSMRSSLDEKDIRQYDLEKELRVADDDLADLRVEKVKVEVEREVLAERVADLKKDLSQAEEAGNDARAEAVTLAAKLQAITDKQKASEYQNDISDIKNLVKHLEDSLKEAIAENAMLRGNGDEYKESEGITNNDIENNKDRSVEKCQQLSDWLVDEAQLSPADAVYYAAKLVKDGKSTVRRLKKALKKNSDYLSELGINGDGEVKSIIEALALDEHGGRDSVSSTFPTPLSASAPRPFSRLSFSPGVSFAEKKQDSQERPQPVHQSPFKSSSQSLRSSFSVEEKESPETLEQRNSRLAMLEAQAVETSRLAAIAAKEADRVTELYSRRTSMSSEHDSPKKEKVKELRQ